MTPFEDLIHQLGHSLDLDLVVDQHHACALRAHEKLTVQLQLDGAQEKLLIASFLIELPPGRFRENVLIEALKANHLPDPRTGILGFHLAKNSLTMHQRYPLAIVNKESILMFTASFIDYAELWRAAIEAGHTSPAPIERTHRR